MLVTPAPTNTSQTVASVLPVNAAVVQQLEQEIPSGRQSAYLEMSEEEHLEVLAKMRLMVQQPVGHLPAQEELYLEQQLTDMLGFEICAELEEQRLNHMIGVMSALPHLRRFPTDKLEQHEQYREAGLSPCRSAFGWFTKMGQLTNEVKQAEAYYVAVQAQFTPGWHEQFAQRKNWYKFRKMLVINPVESVAVVATIGDLGPAQWMQYQFGGSPEIIRDAKVWSLNTSGKVLMFFVNDPQNHIPLGVVSLNYQDLMH